MSCRLWLRVDLPQQELDSLCKQFFHCEFLLPNDALTEEQLMKIDAVFTEEALPDELAAKMASLSWLHVTRGGVNTYLTPIIKSRPIQVTGSKGIHATAFSEFALACIFSLAKKLPQCMAAQSQTRWERLIPEEITGKTVGIVGLGTVGSELARKATALGLHVIATKRKVNGKPEFVDKLGGPDFLPTLLAESDFVVLSLAAVPSTTNIIGEAELRGIKKSAYLINLTGGRAISEALLVRALKENWLAGAALDAFPRQPLPADSELWRLPNVIITPRIGGVPSQKWPSLLPIFVDNLKRFLAGKPLRNVVNKELGY
jgi:phosphoglycerate dehydrogenase-like enzyme